ncbi:hypothetical protein KO02_08190 [Sphingobacterium sp. ML3W]|nr:hypothetical protein KO02_08190 [Sphingobacterium sp. ML3W]
MKKYYTWIIGFIALTCLILIYKFFNPMQYNLFPKCPFYALTGYKCPGCGSQRAIHDLLNFDFYNAWRQNFLVVIAIPYIITGLSFEYNKNPTPKILKWRKILFGYKAIIIVFIIVVSFWIIRNY